MALTISTLPAFKTVLTEGVIYKLGRESNIDKLIKPYISINGTGSVDIYMCDGIPATYADMIKIRTAALQDIYDLNVQPDYICFVANGAGTRKIILCGIIVTALS